ncbi:MAG: ATP-binding protein, partial [Chloroflexi bacterium]|nr:ATP-binding protein [Chloroflexota bacterium]
PELSLLTPALDDAIEGRGQMVMLAGEAGIGKTRISQELAGLAVAKGPMVLRGPCYEHGGARARTA